MDNRPLNMSHYKALMPCRLQAACHPGKPGRIELLQGIHAQIQKEMQDYGTFEWDTLDHEVYTMLESTH